VRRNPSSSDLRVALDAFRRIVQVLRTSANDAERRAGLTSAQLFALQQLSSNPGASINDLAAYTFTHQSSVSVVVRRLVERRLIRKVVAKDDRRRVTLQVTDAGRRLLRRSPEPAQEQLIAGIAALNSTQRHALATALADVAGTMGGRSERVPMLFEDGVRPRRPMRSRRQAGRRRLSA
jgi:DNA-binding MarR family transcriptional regulator